MSPPQGCFASALLLVALVAAPCAAHGAAPITVTVEGAVQAPGIQEHEVGSRFSDALEAAAPRRDAYALGASVFRATAHTAQVRQRAGLLYDLMLVAESSQVSTPVASRAAELHAWVESLPATGRVPLEGNVRRLEVTLGDTNSLLVNGDHLLLPERPDTVTVVGAVQAHCTMQHVPDQDAAAYVRACPGDSQVADPDTLVVIQPDGYITELGTAMWNRAAAQALAPGAIVLVPFDPRRITQLAPDLNSSLASFLATQPLPHDQLVSP